MIDINENKLYHLLKKAWDDGFSHGCSVENKPGAPFDISNIKHIRDKFLLDLMAKATEDL